MCEVHGLYEYYTFTHDALRMIDMPHINFFHHMFSKQSKAHQIET